MKEIHAFQCDLCHKQYDTAERALNCEKNHTLKKPTIHYVIYGKPKELSFFVNDTPLYVPEKICVIFDYNTNDFALYQLKQYGPSPV